MRVAQGAVTAAIMPGAGRTCAVTSRTTNQGDASHDPSKTWARFFARVVPWPRANEHGDLFGWVNLHFMFDNQKGTSLFGRPYQTINALTKDLARLTNQPAVKDL